MMNTESESCTNIYKKERRHNTLLCKVREYCVDREGKLLYHTIKLLDDGVWQGVREKTSERSQEKRKSAVVQEESLRPKRRWEQRRHSRTPSMRKKHLLEEKVYLYKAGRDRAKLIAGGKEGERKVKSVDDSR